MSRRRSSRSTPRTILVSLLLAPLIMLLVIGGIGFWIASVNDAVAERVEERLLALPLPESTELVDSYALAGKYAGNGNGMQYLGALLINSDLPLAELQEFYSGEGAVTATTDEQALANLHGAHGFFDDPGVPNRYIVHSSGEGPGPFFEQWDLRGH